MTGRSGHVVGLLAAASVVGALAGFTVTAAAAAWTEPFDLFPPHAGYAYPPRVAIDGTGNAVFAWIANRHVVTRSRSAAGGALGPVREIGPAGARFAQVVVAPDGRTTVAWLHSDGATTRVQAQSFSPQGTPEPLLDVSAPGARVPALPPQLALAADGAVIVAWRATAGLQARAVSTTGERGPILEVVPFRVRPSWRMVAGAGGNAVFTWEHGERFERPPTNRVYARSLSKAGVLGPIVGVSRARENVLAPSPEVAVGPDGRAVVVWTGGFQTYRVRARRLSAVGAPGAIVDVSTAGSGQPEPHVAVDAEANAIITWTGALGEDATRLDARRLSPSGALGRRVTIANQTYSGVEAAGVTADGGALIAWADDAGIHVRTLSAAGTLGPTATLPGSKDGSIPDLAVAPNGRAAITWETGHGLGRTYRARGAAGP